MKQLAAFFVAGILGGAAAATTAEPTLATTTPPMSLYQIEGSFENQNSRKSGLDVARGETTLMAMFYATCPMACPMLIADIKRVLAPLSDTERARVRIVLVSLDPERDTTQVLQKTIDTRALDPKQWTLLRTDSTTTRTLASALGVRYRDNDDGSIDHTSRIVLLDGNGTVVAAREAIGGDAAPFTEQIRTQLRSGL